MWLKGTDSSRSVGVPAESADKEVTFLLRACPKCNGALFLNREDYPEWVCLNCGKRINLWNIEELMKIELSELEKSIEAMTRRQELYRVLKRALEKRGYWKELPRGNPQKGYQMKGRLAGANGR